MKKAEFFYNNPLAPRPNKPNLIGTAILIEYYDPSIIISYPDGNIFRSITLVYQV